MLLLSESDVEALCDFTELRSALEQAFIAIAERRVDVPARIQTATDSGLLLAMPGAVGDEAMAVKLVSLFPGNDAIGLPSHQGLIAVFDPATGTPVAVMGAEYLTQMRTAMCAAIAADLCARPGATRLAIVGAGAQGAGHLRTFASIRQWDDIRIWNRTPARAVQLASTHELAEACSEVSEAVVGADVVVLATHAPEPLLRPEELASGVHVSSVGIGRELPEGLVATAEVVVEWRGAAAIAPPAGALDLESVDAGDVIELGEVIAGRQVRRSEDQTTIWKSIGHAAEDVAASLGVYQRALATGRGISFDLNGDVNGA